MTKQAKMILNSYAAKVLTHEQLQMVNTDVTIRENTGEQIDNDEIQKIIHRYIGGFSITA